MLSLVGEQRRFEGFEALDHVTIAEALDLVDFEAAAEVRCRPLIEGFGLPPGASAEALCAEALCTEACVTCSCGHLVLLCSMPLVTLP